MQAAPAPYSSEQVDDIDYEAFRVGVSEAWQLLLRVRKGGAHEQYEHEQESERIREYSATETAVDWYVSALVLLGILALDMVVLQQFPETELSHVSMLLFWLMFSMTVALEIGLRCGVAAFADWSMGHLVEVFFSMDLVV